MEPIQLYGLPPRRHMWLCPRMLKLSRGQSWGAEMLKPNKSISQGTHFYIEVIVKSMRFCSLCILQCMRYYSK